MAEGYTRAATGNMGRRGLPVPIWLLAYIQPGLIQSQSCALSAKLRARMYKEDFQAVDIDIVFR
jgi:glyoxylate carboligase